MSEYIIQGVHLSKSHPLYQEYVENAYQNKERPLCACTHDGVPMYIAKTSNSEYHIKRMPNTGQYHDQNCDSYEIPSELSGRGEVENKAVQEDQDTGITNLKLDFSLSKLAVNREMGKGTGAEKTTVEASPTKLSIRSLLHLLYEEANLNKWSPKMEGKRNWYIVRKYLLEGANNKVARNTPLSDSLLIPEPFKLEQKDEIVARRKKVFSKLKPQQQKKPMGLLVGELKEIETARFGYKMLIKHMPETPLFMGEDVYKSIYKSFGTELSFFEEDESVHLMVIATFSLSPSGNPSIDTISFMLTDHNWLPFENLEDKELLERLCSSKRFFIKGLRYNLKSNDVIASVLLTDTEEPTAVYVTPAGASEEFVTEQGKVIENSELNSYIWDIDSEQMLVLPEPKQNQRENEHHAATI